MEWAECSINMTKMDTCTLQLIAAELLHPQSVSGPPKVEQESYAVLFAVTKFDLWLLGHHFNLPKV